MTSSIPSSPGVKGGKAEPTHFTATGSSGSSNPPPNNANSAASPATAVASETWVRIIGGKHMGSVFRFVKRTGARIAVQVPETNQIFFLLPEQVDLANPAAAPPRAPRHGLSPRVISPPPLSNQDDTTTTSHAAAASALTEKTKSEREGSAWQLQWGF